MEITNPKRRKRSDSQQPDGRKRQKTVQPTSARIQPRPSAVDLALRLLLHDSDESQLRNDDINQVLDSVCSPDTLSTLLREPLAQLMRQVDTTQVASPEKLAAIRNELLET
ncbi:hypothetical protein LTR10_010253 [Elasticomyces elasticus]|nr:hypothetical protein LTR10_010253 [Elasticomyces elasticus]KAK4972158.1 hypothetical protein LTR42_006664 [Elasticomyces elasticus]